MAGIIKSEDVEKIHSSPTGGVQVYPLEGPMGTERYRLSVGMTDEDRARRRQFLRDQVLAESEPIQIPGYYEARYNPIRRFYAWPLNQLCKPLYNKMSYDHAFFIRYNIGKGFMAMWGIFAAYYYFKYNGFTWQHHSGWRVYKSKPLLLPGDPGYGEPKLKKPSDFCVHGIDKSPI